MESQNRQAFALSHLCNVFCVLFILAGISLVTAGSGCANGSQNGLLSYNQVAACPGNWYGHVRNASQLCAPGWQVCQWHDNDLLGKITWDDALSIQGCYTYNAAHDGGRCRECRDDLEQDDMAGIGRGCPHQNWGQTSCITGGRIDASCCVDSHFHRACHQQPGIDGVMCCKMPAERPRIVVPPRERMEVYSGSIFMLNCGALGSPPPRQQWYKDGRKIPTSKSRISVLTSGDLLVTSARKSDSGLYSCEVINEEGIDMASSHVIVKERSSGCRDGSTEGLNSHSDIHACSGVWKGHVKRGKLLCQKGWHVCSTQDEGSLKELNWLDIFDLKGCYAYNAANHNGKCQRCHKGKLAGIGRECGRVHYSGSSCLSQGRIDVFSPSKKPSHEEACNYSEGFTTGVICCKNKKKKHDLKRPASKPQCEQGCQNGGVCIGYNQCLCSVGYKGAMCQNPICNPSCGSRAQCVKPGKCKCLPGYTGDGCRRKDTHICIKSCLNGGRCRRGKCKCPPTHWGSSCQHLYQHILLTHLNRTER
ncbi:hypothetical protein CHS0354_041195 [Potamilus streckersoni]|uniref:Uncharacterized protein n=1 Tax=Potamilus streckersoni TaxID=2493646 RepID=A0AAE0VTK8_9BIVA|nr:hypothetical protein CHS0354_041195 [Potamilus streckersoni]